MKQLNYLIVFLICVCGSEILSQSAITIDGSQVFSNFEFTGKDGKRDLNYTTVSSGGYSLGYRKKIKGFFIRANAGMRHSGSALPDNNSIISWNLQYCDLRLGVGYEFTKWLFRPYISAAPYYALLLKANQNVDGVDHDIKTSKAIKNSDAGIMIIPGVKFVVSDYFSVYSEFSYLKGFQNIETSGNQILKNAGYMLSLGISVTITKTKPKWL